MRVAKRKHTHTHTHKIEEGERRGREKKMSRRIICERRFVEPMNHLAVVFKFVARENTISLRKIWQRLLTIFFFFVCIIWLREREREGGMGGGKYVAGKVILLYRQTTLPIGIGAWLRIVARATDAYNLTLAQKEWASPGSKLTMIDRVGWFYWLNKSDRSFFRAPRQERGRLMRNCETMNETLRQKIRNYFFCKCKQKERKKGARKKNAKRARKKKQYECTVCDW